MPFEFIQIPANGQGSAKEELNKLLRGGRIASVRKEFVSNGEDSFWAFCIEFLDGTLGADKSRGGTSGPKVDYKEVLNAEDFAVFAKLRDLRKAISDKEAIPAYAIFTNEQLAAMVTGKVDSLTAMGTVPGVGAARFPDAEILHWLEQIIRGHDRRRGRETAEGADRILTNAPTGLPIGSLTSQHLANFYLSPLDRFCQALPGVRAHVRYMDDFVCWADDKAALIAAGREIQRFVEEELGLTLKHPPCPQRTARGMDFLGYRIFPDHAELNRRSKLRYRRRLRVLDALHEAGEISESGLQQRLTALTAFVLPVRSHAFWRRVMETIRSAAIGHEPGEPGRQLEQQREQLPRREPQQQQPGQLQQQHGVPHSPQLRPNAPDGAMSMGLNRPPSRSQPPAGCDKNTKHPPGAGRPADAGLKAPGGHGFPMPQFSKSPTT